MDNIGQCHICQYMRIPGESLPMEQPAWCYMFREAPVGDCKKLKPYPLSLAEAQSDAAVKP